MKCSEMLKVIGALSGLIRAADAERSAQLVDELSTLVAMGGTSQVKAFVDEIRAAGNNVDGVKRHLELLMVMKEFEGLAKLTARVAVTKDVALLNEALQKIDCGLDELAAMLRDSHKTRKASTSTKKRASPSVRNEVVVKYARGLRQMLDGHGDFLSFYDSMQGDRKVRKQEAAAIAQAVLGSGAKSDTKKKSFQRILDRYQSRADLDAKLESMRGRTVS